MAETKTIEPQTSSNNKIMNDKKKNTMKVVITYTKEQQKKIANVKGNQNIFCTPHKAFWKPI